MSRVRRLLFFGLGHLSNGDVSIAADFARQLPPTGFEVCFVTAPEAAPLVRSLGLAVQPLRSESPEGNVAAVDALVSDFRPDLLVAADAFTLNYSTTWSGLSLGLLRERYGLPLASFDQYDYPAADYVVDFYAGHRTRFPRLLDDCDLLIRNSPLNRPAPPTPGVIVTRMVCGTARPGSPDSAPRSPADPPVVFLANSKWEYVNVVKSAALAQLVEAMPAIIHSHLAALGRPLRVVHVGPVSWQFPIAEHLEYRHFDRLPQPMFHEQLAAADLFVTANVASVTLAQAVLAGVPSLLLQNHRVLDVGRLTAQGCAPAWLRAAAPGLTMAAPFRVFPWGWHDLLGPVLSANPYTGCFRTVGVFERGAVLRELTTLLDDAPSRTALHEAQLSYRDRLSAVAAPAEAFASVVSAR